MAFVVTENCQRCRYTECVDVCPVDCFYGDAEMLYINPDECIDCNACVPACPVEAIFSEDDIPDDQEKWTDINREKCESGELDHITEMADAYPGADERKEELGF
jgi:ferredoxin